MAMDMNAAAGSIAARCLALTGSFETGHLAPECFATATGNFDGQGMSFGALQWNFGQGTLQPMLGEMLANHPELVASIFGPDVESLKKAIKEGKAASLAFASAIQEAGKKTLLSVWSKRFRALGLTPEFQAIEIKAAAAYYERAVRLSAEYGLWTARGRALMFDLCVQNGGIPDPVKRQILADIAMLPAGLSPEETELQKMRIIANRRAEAANPKFVEDVRKRKLCIAEGKGSVHGIAYDLSAQFGIDLRKAD